MYTIHFLVENYVHEESYAVSSSHFGKKQSTLLVATVWFKNKNGDVVKQHFDFVSPYLSHNDLFYVKCFGLLMDELQLVVHYPIKRLIIVTDGGNHFVSRYAFWGMNLLCIAFGTY